MVAALVKVNILSPNVMEEKILRTEWQQAFPEINVFSVFLTGILICIAKERGK
jgi:hypothetical protein